MEAVYQEENLNFQQIWEQSQQIAHAELNSLRQTVKITKCKRYRNYSIFGSTVINTVFIFLIIF
jgi:hypothetical protein